MSGSSSGSQSGAMDAHAATVQTGYDFEGPAIELGALVVDGAARADVQVRIPLAMVNRHGLVAGATGTGKTKTLQLMAEQLCSVGVPVLAADIKGDLSGLAMAGEPNDKVSARATEVGQEWAGVACPVELLALGGEGTGLPLRATMTSFGPTLLAKVLDLNEVQESSLGLVFHFADKAGLAMLDLKDLGGLSRATGGVILRELIAFEDQGADRFFGEPEFQTSDLLRVLPDGRGVVSLLELPRLQDRPQLFSTFLMWLLADLFEELPEVGDVDKPKLVFFFDEAHLLFDDASKEFLHAVAQTVRLIRSKGVGVFFVTQTPSDVPAEVLAQLGNRVQHALRAFTPADARALKATASTFPNSAYDLEEVLTQLGIGEAVVTVLSDRGAPTPVAWTRLRAPQSRMAPADESVLAQVVAASPLRERYVEEVDRESAYERLAARVQQSPAPEGPAGGSRTSDEPRTTHEPRAPRTPRPSKPERSTAKQVLESSAFKQLARSAAAVVGLEIARSIFGTRRR